MKLLVLSDLHMEFSAFEPLASDADLVVLAGDIDIKARGVSWANSAFAVPVIYVCGNHEFYSGHIDRTLKKMQEQALSHVHVLENDALICQQTRFLCCTAWTDYTSTGDAVSARRVCWDVMNDFRVIRADASYRRLRPDDLISRNHASWAWLNQELVQPFAGRTVVITHHCPLPQVMGSKHDGHVNAAYSNDWPDLVSKADLWIFGHTHEAVDVVFEGCRIVSNPRGYPREDTGFQPDFLVEI